MIHNNRRNQKKQSGITLVALVVTIVILIILATITINVVFDDGGLIDIVKGAKNNAEDLVQSEDKKMNDLLQEYANIMGGNVEIPEPDPEVDTIPPIVTVTSEGITTNSITVNVQATDNESGMKENPTYTYYIKKSSEADSSYQVKAIDVTNSSYTFTGLQQERSYDIKVEVNGDKAGNKGTGTLTGQVTTKVPGGETGVEEGAITFGSTTWSGGKASITISTNTGMQIQYQVDSTSGNWTNISNGGTVGSLQHGQTVYARLTDGTNYGDYASASIVDGIKPTISIMSAKAISNTIEVIVEASDGQSGLATSGTYKFYFDDYLMSTTENPYYIIKGLPGGTQYKIKVEVFDKAGNKGEKSTTVTTDELTVSDAIDNGTQFEDTTKIEDDSGDEVWIPGGFEIADDSATDADDGIVIQDSKGNQFVWIPVPDYTTMYATGTYTLCGVSTQTSVYSKLRIRSGESTNITTPGNTSGTREPDLVTIYDINLKYYSILARSAQAMADDMVEEYTETYNSIKKYKGFYIGRYELTGTVSSPTVKKGRTVLTDQNWYNLKKACTNIVSSSYAQSIMVYGNQWDEIMSWLVRTGDKTNSQVNIDSSSWGNYSSSTGAAATNSGSKQISGKNEAWKANNIYDLAGNCFEYTQEAVTTMSRFYRGR